MFDRSPYFGNHGSIESIDVVTGLAALSQEFRLVPPRPLGPKHIMTQRHPAFKFTRCASHLISARAAHTSRESLGYCRKSILARPVLVDSVRVLTDTLERPISNRLPSALRYRRLLQAIRAQTHWHNCPSVHDP